MSEQTGLAGRELMAPIPEEIERMRGTANRTESLVSELFKKLDLLRPQNSGELADSHQKELNEGNSPMVCNLRDLHSQMKANESRIGELLSVIEV